MYGHIHKLALAEQAGLKKAGIEADLFQYEQSLPSQLSSHTNIFVRVPETLPQDVLTKMHAPPKDTSIPVITAAKLAEYDAFLIGIPTRYGNFPGQWKAFWDTTGGLWASGGLWGKYAGLFVSTAGPGGGQESTAIAAMSTFAHHGVIYVPLGYARAFGQLTNLEVVHGGSPWGAGTYAASDGSRQPNALEIELAEIHGAAFGEVLNKVSF